MMFWRSIGDHHNRGLVGMYDATHILGKYHEYYKKMIYILWEFV